MSKFCHWLLLLVAICYCIQFADSKYDTSYPTSTDPPMLPRAETPRLPCGLDEVYQCCDPLDPRVNNTCCFGLKTYNDSDSCVAKKNCKYFVSYHYDNDTHYEQTLKDGTHKYHIKNYTEAKWINFTMQSTAGVGYVAYGLSYDAKMGSDLVVVCELTASYEIKMYLTWNIEKENRRLDPIKIKQHKFFEFKEGIYINGKFTCSFGLGTRVSVVLEDPHFNFTLRRNAYFYDNYRGLLAGGKVKNGRLMYHDDAYIITWPNNKWSYTNFCKVGAALPNYREERFHVAYAVVLFTFLIPFITIYGRFFKDYFQFRINLLDHRKFYVLFHVFQGLSAVYMMTTIYVGVSGTRSRGFTRITYSPTNIHGAMGFVVIALFLIQFVASLWNNGTWFQCVTKYIHGCLAMVVQLTGSITLIAAPFLTYNVVPCHFPVYSVLWLIIILWTYWFMHGLRIFADRRFDYFEDYSCLMFPLRNRTLPNLPYHIERNRRRVVAFFILSSVLLSCIQLLFLSMELVPPCYPAHRAKNFHKSKLRYHTY